MLKTLSKEQFPMPETRKHVFYGHVKNYKSRKSRGYDFSKDVTITIRSTQLDKNILKELKKSVTPICFVVDFFINPEDKTSI